MKDIRLIEINDATIGDWVGVDQLLLEIYKLGMIDWMLAREVT